MAQIPLDDAVFRLQNLSMRSHFALSSWTTVAATIGLAFGASSIHGQVVVNTELINETFDAAGPAFPAEWTYTPSGRSAAEVAAPGTGGLTAGSGGTNQMYFLRDGGGATSTPGATVSTTFDIPTDTSYVTVANLSFDYAFATLGDGNADQVTVAVMDGPIELWSQTGGWGATGTVSADLLSLFNDNAGETLTLRFSTLQPSTGGNPNNHWTRFAVDNILLSYTEVLPEPPGGGGSGASAAAVANMNANRRAQQQFQAHQARVARMQVAQQHRRNQQR